MDIMCQERTRILREKMRGLHSEGIRSKGWSKKTCSEVQKDN